MERGQEVRIESQNGEDDREHALIKAAESGLNMMAHINSEESGLSFPRWAIALARALANATDPKVTANLKKEGGSDHQCFVIFGAIIAVSFFIWICIHCPRITG